MNGGEDAMNLRELGEAIDDATDVLRVETLPRYASASDHDWVAVYLRGDPPPPREAKQGWLDRLAARERAGHPQRRLRVIERPVSDYVRYACEWGYVDNAAAGEDVRVLDAANDAVETDLTRWVADYYVLDGRVVIMEYDQHGAFTLAHRAINRTGRMRRRAEALFTRAVPFTEWWAANADLHRDPAPASVGR